MTKEEKKRKHKMNLQVEAQRRYREKKPRRVFSIDLSVEDFERIDTELKKRNITKKQFVLDSFEKLMKED